MAEDVNTYLAMIEAYKRQLDVIDEQNAYIRTIMNEYLRAKITIENLEKGGRGGEILIPIGGGVFIPAKCEKVSEVLVSEGANILILKDLNEAKESLDNRIKDLRNNMDKLLETYQKVSDRIEELSKKVRELIEKKR